MHVLVVKDTVPLNRLHEAFAKGYGELFAFCSQQQLKTGKVMAFYSGYTDPLYPSHQTNIRHDGKFWLKKAKYRSSTVEVPQSYGVKEFLFHIALAPLTPSNHEPRIPHRLRTY